MVGKYDSEYASSHKDEEGKYERPWSTPVAPLPAPTVCPWTKQWKKTIGLNDDDDDDEEEDTDDESSKVVNDNANDATVVVGNDVQEEIVSLTLESGVTEVKVEFPSEDDSCGTVVLGWRTEEYGDQLFQEMTKLDILMRCAISHFSYVSINFIGPMFHL